MTVSEFFELCMGITFVGSGFGASVYRVTGPDDETKAVKVAHRPVQAGRAIETCALQHLEHCDAVPRFIEDLAPCAKYPFGGFVLGWVEGAPMKRDFDLATLGRAIGTIHATTEKLQAGRHSNFEQVSPTDALVKECLEYLDTIEFDPEVKIRVAGELHRRAQDYLRAIPQHTKSCLVHTDLISENILISGSSVALIDWEYARWSHPFWDLAHFISPTTTRWDTPPAKPYNLSDLEKLVTGYVSAFRRYSAAETMRAVAALVPLSAIQSTLWAMFQLAQAEGDVIADYERLLRYKIEDVLAPNGLELAEADPP